MYFQKIQITLLENVTKQPLSVRFQLYIENIYYIYQILFHPQMHNTYHTRKYFCD